MDEFERELEHLINKHSIDVFMKTPDFVLADHICRYLREMEVFQRTRTAYKVPESKTVLR